MKKILLFLCIAFSLRSVAHAQSIVNGGFEQLNINGTPSFWGNVYLQTVGDSVVIDNQYYASTNDAFSGTKALELRNGWNYTTNHGIAGAAGADDDTIFNAYGLLNLVTTNSTPFNPFHPLNFGFYYKYFPVNGDSAYAQIQLWDSSGNLIADGTAIITDSANSYTQIVTPINYLMSGVVSFYSFSFHTFYSVAIGSHEPSFGTKLLVDAISFNNFNSTVSDLKPTDENAIYPNPAADLLNIKSPFNNDASFCIYNLFGQMMQSGSLLQGQTTVTLENLNAGFYSIEFISSAKTERKNFVVCK